jgi:hypothetical protein
LLVLVLTYRYVHGQTQRIQMARIHTKNAVVQVAQAIDRKLGSIKPVLAAIADDLSAGTLTQEQLLQRLQATFEIDTHFFAEVGVAYNPRAHEGTLYAPHYGKIQEKAQFFQIEQFYDYTTFDWYKRAIVQGPHWVEPYFGEATRDFVAGFCVPFFLPQSTAQDRTPDGVVRLNFSLQDARELVASPVLGKTGYGFLLSQHLAIIAHPIKDYLGKSLADLAAHDDILRAISQGQETVEELVTHQSAWIFYEPIPSTGWTIGVVFNPKEIFDNTTILRRQRCAIALSVLAGLFFLALLMFRVDRGSAYALWASGISTALLCGIGISYIWYLAVTTASDAAYQDNAVVINQAGAEAAVHNLLPPGSKQREDFDHSPPLHVPTGVFVQSIEFTGANNVQVTGYVWQRYPDGIPETLVPGTVFPETVRMTLTEVYRKADAVGWYFTMTVRQQFNYAQYPFDRQDVWLRLWHKDFFYNTILVPDFASYAAIQPELKPGLESDLLLEDWEIQNSFFSYRNEKYNTLFKTHGYLDAEYPELQFNIGLLRNFARPFITEMIPLVIVAFLLFSVLLISTNNEQKMGILGFSASAVLGYCAALFFVLIVKHTQLRNALAVHGITYIEYFYFVMYLAILGVSLNSLLLASKCNVHCVHYQDNLLIKVLYWPVILGIMLVVTLCVFY